MIRRKDKDGTGIPTTFFPEDPVNTVCFGQVFWLTSFADAFPSGRSLTVAGVLQNSRGLQQRGLLRDYTGFPF
ncbi:hypothetical protein C8N47_1299 [Mangrovibacterium marinum]|uniref:Uncharacterized protein n=1 Tax=Mangrovibacterium marinum TaxID=1639118 RepID=A0A2T5BXA4_9BACT|nr:hypothetical protein C8N47_1299 [Mangrovibacterium marinum]